MRKYNRLFPEEALLRRVNSGNRQVTVIICFFTAASNLLILGLL